MDYFKQISNPEENSEEETIVGIKYPDDSVSFAGPGNNFPGLGVIEPATLLTEAGRGQAQDTYQKTLKKNGIPASEKTRLRFVTRTIVTTFTTVTDLKED